jgi:hypothetical protein
MNLRKEFNPYNIGGSTSSFIYGVERLAVGESVTVTGFSDNFELDTFRGFGESLFSEGYIHQTNQTNLHYVCRKVA